MDERWWIGIIAIAIGAVLVFAGSIALLRFIFRSCQRKSESLLGKAPKEKKALKDDSKPLLRDSDGDSQREEDAYQEERRYQEGIVHKSSYPKSSVDEEKTVSSSLSRRKKAEVVPEDEVIGTLQENLEPRVPEQKKKEVEKLIDFEPEASIPSKQDEVSKENILVPSNHIEASIVPETPLEPIQGEADELQSKLDEKHNFAALETNENLKKEETKEPQSNAQQVESDTRSTTSKEAPFRPSSARRLGAKDWEEDVLLSDDEVVSVTSPAKKEEEAIVNDEMEVEKNSTETETKQEEEVPVKEVQNDLPQEEIGESPKDVVVGENWLDIPDDALEKLIQMDNKQKKRKGKGTGPIKFTKKQQFDLSQFAETSEEDGENNSSFTFTPEALEEEPVPKRLPSKKRDPKARPSLPWMEDFQKEKQEKKVVIEREWIAGQDPLIRSFSAREEINRKGLKRAKKGVPIQMEDAHYAAFPFDSNDKKSLFCVFDGHGGKECAETLSQLFPLEMAKKLKATEGSEKDVSAVFDAVYKEVDRAMRSYEYVGSTATTVFVWQEGEKRYLQAANVGDSTAFLQRREGVVCLSRDHKPNKEYERRRIIASGISMTDTQTRLGGLSVSRALGDHFLKEEKMGIICDPFVSECYELEPADTLLILASDGLWDVMSGDRAMEIAQHQETAEDMSKALMQAALANPKCLDNVTIIVVVL